MKTTMHPSAICASVVTGRAPVAVMAWLNPTHTSVYGTKAGFTFDTQRPTEASP